MRVCSCGSTKHIQNIHMKDDKVTRRFKCVKCGKITYEYNVNKDKGIK